MAFFIYRRNVLTLLPVVVRTADRKDLPSQLILFKRKTVKLPKRSNEIAAPGRGGQVPGKADAFVMTGVV